jgi:hypothetical protein
MLSSATVMPQAPVGANYKASTCADVVSEGGLEPLAYILGASAEPWLSV